MRKLTFDREASPIPKDQLKKGDYYIGISRNARVARWDGEKFLHWRNKWGNNFIETIKHREDDQIFDVFDAWARVDNIHQIREIPLEQETPR